MKPFAGRRVMVVKKRAAKRPAAVPTTARGGRVNGSSGQGVETAASRRECKAAVPRITPACPLPILHFVRAPMGGRGWGGRSSYDGNARAM